MSTFPERNSEVRIVPKYDAIGHAWANDKHIRLFMAVAAELPFGIATAELPFKIAIAVSKTANLTFKKLPFQGLYWFPNRNVRMEPIRDLDSDK